MKGKEQVILTNTEDLKHCESEDLVHKDFIQSYGCLLVIDEDSKKVQFYSSNTHEMFQNSEISIGTIPKIISIDGTDLLEEIIKRVEIGYPIFIGYTNVNHSDYSLETLAHKSIKNPKQIIIEFVPYTPKNTANDALMNSMLINRLSYLISNFNSNHSIKKFIDESTALIQQFLKYDRVIFYKFNEDWSGEVLSEAVEDGLEQKYIGLHFPASDIPSQARELFTKNPVRVIADVNSKHSSILTSKDQSEMFDQTYSTLRISSDFHLDYLRNMGSEATLTISILIDNKLWGMLSCHHREPKIPPFDHRQSILSIITIIGQVFSTQLQSKLEIEQLKKLNIFIKNLEEFRRQSNIYSNFNEVLKHMALLVKEDLECDGIAIFIEDKLYNDTINPSSIDFIKDKLLNLDKPTSFTSLKDNEFKGIFIEDDMVAGYFYPFNKLTKGGIFLSRKEWIHTVYWAGQPNIYSKVKTQEGKTVLGVRNSFDTWKQEVKGKSKPWSMFLNKLCEELEGTVNTLHTIDQLNYAKKKAEESTRTKSQFLANMSHEIRTPLNGIIGLTNLVLNEDLQSSQREYLNQVLKSSELLLHVLNDILDYSKIDAGRLGIEHKEFEHDTAIKNTLDMFEHNLAMNHNTLKVSIEPKLPSIVIGDIFRFKQVLNNLLGNAIKFTKDGEISLKISKESETPTQIVLKYEISDTGIGMSEETLEKLFGSFMQSDVSHSRKFGGTGLGLAISKLLIELMGGEIWVESKLDHGSKFSFTINYEKTLSHKLKDSNNNEKLNNNNIKILIAEDDSVNQMVIKGYMNLLNINFDLVEDGFDAVDYAKKNNYDLIFMDIQMPNKNGYDAAKEIREFNKKTPIVALSAAVLEEDVNKTKKAGMNSHLSKPFKEEDLIKCLNEYLVI